MTGVWDEYLTPKLKALIDSRPDLWPSDWDYDQKLDHVIGLWLLDQEGLAAAEAEDDEAVGRVEQRMFALRDEYYEALRRDGKR